MAKLYEFLLLLETIMLLLLTLMEPIVCPAVKPLTTQSDTTSVMDTSEYISDNLFAIMENYDSENQTAQTQHQQYLPKLQIPATKELSNTDIEETIHNLFYTGSNKIFENTYALTPIPHMLGDQPFIDMISPTEEVYFVNKTANLERKAELQGTTRTPTIEKPLLPDAVPNCEGESFNLTSLCTKVRNYPKNVDSVLQQQYAKYELFFGADYTPQELSSRNNFLPSEEFLCQSDERTIFPESGQTVDNKMRWIVNYGNYTQGIRVEKCRREGAPCSKLQGSLPNGYKATCKQHYIYRPLVAIQSDGSPIIDQFKIPSCCKCVLTQGLN